MNEIPPKLAETSTEDLEESGHDEDTPYLSNLRLYKQALKSIEDMSMYLRPLLESKYKNLPLKKTIVIYIQ